MDFGKAIEALKSGKKVSRVGWNGKGMYLSLVLDTCDYAMDTVREFPDIAVACDKFKDSPTGMYVPTDSYIVMKTAQNTVQPGWLASQADMLAEDWTIIG
tara:strand:- start:448 stop:747 length:300 start_codon:yes stop_codon:yes gene_type:complete